MASECNNVEENRQSCNCTYEPCSRKGMCCECVRYHLSMRELPACAFSKEAERSYTTGPSRSSAASGSEPDTNWLRHESRYTVRGISDSS